MAATALLLSSPLFLPSQNRAVAATTLTKSSCSLHWKSFRGRKMGQGVINQSFRNRRRDTITAWLKKRAKVEQETVIPDSDYRIPIVLLGASGAFLYTNNLAARIPLCLFGLNLLIQAPRLKLVFDDEALEVRLGSELKDSGENSFVGGKNRWKYSTFVNWDFWLPNFPILLYFKETQTKPEGQIHFIPLLFNPKQLYDVMVERLGPSETSAPEKV